MKSKIKLIAEYLHPSEDFNEHPKLRRFKKTNPFGKAFENGAYCLFGEKGSQTILLSVSENDGAFHHTLRKQYLMNVLEDLDRLSLTQCSALISILTRNEGTFDRLINPMAKENAILEELTSQTFGWLLWSWQIMGLISYYLPTIEPNTFIKHLNEEDKGAWRLLNDIYANTGQTLHELMEEISLGLKYNNPPYYFGEQLQQLIHQ